MRDPASKFANQASTNSFTSTAGDRRQGGRMSCVLCC
jgi:hypothetical protein